MRGAGLTCLLATGMQVEFFTDCKIWMHDAASLLMPSNISAVFKLRSEVQT
jgi:hypothetical protein